MRSNTHRLDRFIRRHTAYSLSDTRLLVAQKRISLNGVPAHSVRQQVNAFTHVVVDGKCLQDDKAIYLMLNKPAGFLSATKDPVHRTVMDLICHARKRELHIVGRLDFNSTGLLLLTNDGIWSRSISLPEHKQPKTYEVVLSKPLNERYISAFEQGIFFRYEGITTQPEELTIVSDYTATVTLTEGKYHQIKRMFGFFQNEVVSLHRVSVGPLHLGGLESGQSRVLTELESDALASSSSHSERNACG